MRVFRLTLRRGSRSLVSDKTGKKADLLRFTLLPPTEGRVCVQGSWDHATAMAVGVNGRPENLGPFFCLSTFFEGGGFTDRSQ